MSVRYGKERAAMFKVNAGSVEEYFRFDPGREDDLRALAAGQLTPR